MSRFALLGLPEDLGHQLTRILLAESHQVSRKQYLSDLRRGPRPSAVFISSDGLEYCQTLSLLRETYPKLPVIVVSRFPDVKQWLDALDAGASDYCGAPFERVQLHWILNSVLGWGQPKASAPESEPLSEPILSPG
jgi:DNA-binding NtrC family response regulator